MSTEETGSPEYRRGVRLGTEALHAAMREDWDAMKAALEAMSGSEALIVAIVAWCDTLLARHPDGPHAGDRPVQVGWLEDGKGRVQHAEDVPPPARWAGQVIAARAALDEDAFYALLGAPAEGADLGSCVIALVQSVAMTLGAASHA
jgi:hypothetical protein